jgi:hypothetical protein
MGQESYSLTLGYTIVTSSVHVLDTIKFSKVEHDYVKKVTAQTLQSILCLVSNAIPELHHILIFLYWQDLAVVNNLIYISKSHATSNQLFRSVIFIVSKAPRTRSKETDDNKRRKKPGSRTESSSSYLQISNDP